MISFNNSLRILSAPPQRVLLRHLPDKGNRLLTDFSFRLLGFDLKVHLLTVNMKGSSVNTLPGFFSKTANALG
jgi:hypothetical protein